MNRDTDNIVLNDDENARDEFSAQYFFQKKRFAISDISNTQSAYPVLKVKNNNENNVKKAIFSDITNINCDKQHKDNLIVRKRKSYGENKDIAEKKLKAKISSFKNCSENVTYFVPYDQYNNNDVIFNEAKDIETDSLSQLNNIYDPSDLTVSLSIPASGFNSLYKNQVAVPEPWKCEKLLKIEDKSAIWTAMIETAKVESRTMSSPCRELCSPKEQFSITPEFQYKSHCLIQAYHSTTGDLNSFPKAIALDTVNKIARKNFNLSHNFMADSINISYFHDLFLEKLPCNQLFDFMPHNTELSGIILGGFINNLFEMSTPLFLSNTMIHMAVDFIYMYLSRVRDVPLSDLNLVTLGAIWTASKYEGYQYCTQIARFANCTPSHLKHAEMRLCSVIDINVTKPCAMNFRDRYIIIESTNSTVNLLSNFILDMTLHCYTVMIMPASRRAAAAVWLSRLIDKFDDLRMTASIDNMDEYRDRMDSVWPEHFHQLTGIHHSDIAQLAVRMHVIVLAFLMHEQKKMSSVNACYNKYSSDTYKNITGTYAKFTSRIVYFGAELYCALNNLSVADWLDKKEYDNLQMSVADQKPPFRRCDSSPSRQNEHEANSCPELTSRPLIRPSLSSNATNDKSQLKKLDSGYGTCSNLTSDSF